MKHTCLTLLACFALVATTAGCSATVAPDAPKPTIVAPAEPDRRSLIAETRSIELQKVDVRRIAKDHDELVSRVGPRFLDRATRPIRLAVLTREQLPLGESTSSLVIVLNNTVLHDSWVNAETPNALVAYLPDGTLIQESNRVNLRWIGRPNEELEKQFLTFRASDVQE